MRGRRRHTRDDDTIASPLKLRLPDTSDVLPKVRSILRQLEDRREFSPEIARPARAFKRDASQLVVRGKVKDQSRVQGPVYGPPHAVGFRDPDRVAVCIRRHRRREVLHALRHAGSGGGRKRKRRAKWNEFSDVRC